MEKFKQINTYSVDCDIPLLASVDVLVAGGGPSGIAAAQTAAELGNDTLLLEKHGFLGGAAVAGYSGTFCGLFHGTDNPKADGPKQYVFGFTDKFYQEMKIRGGVTKPQQYGKTFLVPHNPQIFKEVAEDLVLQSGAKVLYHVSVFGVIKEGEEYKGLVLDTKSGLVKVLAKRIIDTTGDGDVIYRAGGEFTLGDNGSIQNPTMIFRLGGVDVDTFLEYWGEDTICPDKVTDLMKNANEQGYSLPRLKVWVYYTTRPNELFMNVTLIKGGDGRALNVCDPVDHTEAEIQSRKQVKEYAKFFREFIPGCENSFINDLSCEVGVRQTRSIVGVNRLTDGDIAAAKKPDDGICKCAWPIELHNGEKPYMYWFVNDYYEIPFGALIPKEGENIMVAGRNLSAQHKALASCRVISQCFEMGHAAGVAVNISIKNDMPIREIKGEEVREEMNKRGSRLEPYNVLKRFDI